MIDKITILIPHVLMAIAVWRLLLRDDLDHDGLAEPPTRSFRRGRPGDGDSGGA